MRAAAAAVDRIGHHAPGRTVIFVGILEKVTDDMNRVTWQPQMDGGKVARRAARHRRSGADDEPLQRQPGAHPDTAPTWRHDPDKGSTRRLVCRSGNPLGLPAKDRSGRLDLTEPPDLGALLTKINQPRKG